MEPLIYTLDQFPNGKVKVSELHKEIAKVIEVGLKGITQRHGQVTIVFEGDLSADQVAQLDVVVAAHQGIKPPDRKFIASSTLIRLPMTIDNVEEWETLAEVVSKPDFFTPDLQLVSGQVLGRMFCVGGGGELRLLEDRGGLGQYIKVIAPTFTVPDTAGTWPLFAFFTDQPPSSGASVYELQARRGSAADFSIKSCNLTLAKVVF